MNREIYLVLEEWQQIAVFETVFSSPIVKTTAVRQDVSRKGDIFVAVSHDPRSFLPYRVDYLIRDQRYHVDPFWPDISIIKRIATDNFEKLLWEMGIEGCLKNISK